ncbi:Conserved_hypothetical protein [Hexamita inflata]|uniref:Protein kinase domain-containing protein n=1 Tax=Hexamita inflata TaxID=28002 RepID=A0AA86TJ24_9EUKA|nr:Conserved hypothetical protein [Hexamita inflata]CAI9930093.1 Conserved hypothetical protein [Hexamita inflata]
MIHVSELLQAEPVIKSQKIPKEKGSIRQAQYTKNQSPLIFSDLLMTFSFEFKSVYEFCGFACKLLSTTIDQCNISYPYDYIFMEQYQLSCANDITIDEPNNLFRLASHMQAPEAYKQLPSDCSALQQHEKKLAYSVGMILLEVISQRPLTIVPEQMTSQQYSRYIHRKERLINLAKIIVQCGFGNEELVIDRSHSRESQAVEHVVNIILRMTEYNPQKRITLYQALELFELFSIQFNVSSVRKANLSCQDVIQNLLDEDPEQTVTIMKNLLSTIQSDSNKQSPFRYEEITLIKKLFNADNIETGVQIMQTMLMKSYLCEKEHKYFAYLQQFFMHFFQQTDRVFVADQISGYVDADYVDADEYYSSENVFLYFTKTGLFQKLEQFL